MDNYCKNFILCGEIDYFCLLCKEAFSHEASVEKHLRWEKHRKYVNKQEHIPKYKYDLIYKIEVHFYCEICNLLCADVPEHINGTSHQTKKNNPEKVAKNQSIVKRNADKTVNIQDKVLTSNQWHCIKDGICLLCNLNVGRIRSHKSSFQHMLNLIQSNVQCANNNYYRELKNDKFYCFECLKPYKKAYLDSHWNNTHKSKNDKNNNSKCIANDENDENIMIRILAKIEKDNFEFDVMKKAAKCLKCEAIVEPELNALKVHKYIHRDPNSEEEVFNAWIYDHGKSRADLAKYGKENYINLNEGGSKGFCSLCNIYISAHINVAKQHVEGAHHRGHLELKGLVKDKKHEKPSCKPIPFKTFHDVMYGPFQFAEYNVIVINDGICLDAISFSFICVVNNFRSVKAKCFACDVFLEQAEIKKHIKDDKHSNIILQCKVLPMETKGDEEFIRQVHPGLYHCGHCNKVLPFWENMARHLKTMKHDVQRMRYKYLSIICAKLCLNPLQDVEDFEEYKTLRNIEGFL